MDHLQQKFSISYQYNIYFTRHLFSKQNTLLIDSLKQGSEPDFLQKILFVIDEGFLRQNRGLEQQIDTYFENTDFIKPVPEKLVIPGGETAKNNPEFFKQVVDAVNDHGIDRHSYLIAIGGGAILDLAGYAAAVSHRGIRHIRIPTTVLSQNDSGIGVKNGINYGGKKNFLGTFATPVAVFNDYHFLETLTDRQWRAGISEAIKVALIKDADFFRWMEEHAHNLLHRKQEAMQQLIVRCAKLHLEHISSGDPFEKGSSRPLDFGHWSAHKLEQLTGFEVLHGEAVAIGIALDSVYSALTGSLTQKDSMRIIRLLQNTGLPVTHPLLTSNDSDNPLLAGLQEFREHLGGRLTIMLLTAIGKGEEVHEMDNELIKKAAKILHNLPTD